MQIEPIEQLLQSIHPSTHQPHPQLSLQQDFQLKQVGQIEAPTEQQQLVDQQNQDLSRNAKNQQAVTIDIYHQINEPIATKRLPFLSLPQESYSFSQQARPLDCQSQQLPLSQGNDPEDDVTFVSATASDVKFRKHKLSYGRRRRSKTKRRPVEIDSKEESVEQVRQEKPKTVIEVEPPEAEPLPKQHIPNGPQNEEQLLQKIYDNDVNTFNSLMSSQQEIVNVAAIFSKMIMDPIAKAVGGASESLFKEVIPPVPIDFEHLFDAPVDKTSQKSQAEAIMALASLTQLQAKDSTLLEIPKAIANLPASISLLQQRLPQICQQYVLISNLDLITGQEDKFELRKLIKSNYKAQICEFIEGRLKRVDASYNYNNVEILKMVRSGYVWDNVIPFMAECLYKDSNLLRVRLLPERTNKDSVSVVKYQAFLILCQMFFGVLPRQIATYDLPISFGEIMTLGDNDSALAVSNKLAKLKCLLHYFSSVLRQKEMQIKNTVQFVAFQRYRYNLRAEALYPQTEHDRIRFRSLRLTDHMAVTRVKYGNQFKKEIALYLTHENPCRESGEESLETPFLMEETYRMMYSRPEIFLLKALTPRLDLGEAIVAYGLEEFCKCGWEDVGQEGGEECAARRFVCGGIWNEPPEYDVYGKRKGAVILIMSKLLFNQSYIRNDREKAHRITENYSFSELKIEIETLYSAFQGRKNFCGEDERILISERYIRFIQGDYRWLYFVIAWVAASIAKVRCIFEFKNSEDENEAVFLMQSLQGWPVHRLLDALGHYRETLIEAHENWNRYVQQIQQDHPAPHHWNTTHPGGGTARRVTTMTFLDFLKELYL